MSKFRLDFNDKLLEQAVRGGILAGMRISAEGLKGDAKAQAPVDTGRLRASISSEVNESTYNAKVGTNVEYAEAVEFGTSKSVVIVPKRAKVLSWIPKHSGTADFAKRGGGTTNKKYWTLRNGTNTLNKGDARVFAKRVVIPPRRARPFLMPALEKWNGKYVNVIASEIKRRIT